MMPTNLRCKLCSRPTGVAAFSTINTHGRHLIDARDSFSMIRCDSCGIHFLDDVVIDGDYYKK